MGFSDSVQALLETYTRCLALLHVFGSQTTPVSAVDEDRQSVLSRSLRSDRAQVRRAYSSRLSEAGSRLSKGDRRSRSALRRVVRRLVDALAGLLGSSSRSKSDTLPRLDYDALRALSNASRIDAIHTIDDLAVRLGSTSGRSARSRTRSSRTRSSRTSSRISKSHSSGRHSHASSPSSTAVSKTRPGRRSEHPHRSAGPRSGKGPKRPAQTVQTAVQGDGSSSLSRRPSAPAPAPAPVQREREKLHKKNVRSHRQPGRSSSSSISSSNDTHSTPGRKEDVHRKHISALSSLSSGSTKLGEVPENKQPRRYETARYAAAGAASDGWGAGAYKYEHAYEYNVRPVYPVRPFGIPEPEEKKKGFWGFMRRS